MTDVSQELINALNKQVAELTRLAETTKRERQEIIEARAELARLRRDHDAEMAAERAAFEEEKNKWRAKVVEFKRKVLETAGA